MKKKMLVRFSKWTKKKERDEIKKELTKPKIGYIDESVWGEMVVFQKPKRRCSVEGMEA